jgi:ATP-dependent RNA helicase RhlE
MLDMGFLPDVRRIIALLPKERQTLLFSATMPEGIARLAASILTRPIRVEAAPPATTVQLVDQRVIFVAGAEKPAVLADLLRDPAVSRALVFARTKHGANRIVARLAHADIYAEAIHGNKSQAARQKALGAFRGGNLRVLIATDIAARGIDVEGVSHVINFDVPNEAESYVHRIGRTARAGASGVAISLCDSSERPFLAGIERLTRLRLQVIEHPRASAALAHAAPAPRQSQGPRNKPQAARKHQGRGASSQRRPAAGGASNHRAPVGRKERFHGEALSQDGHARRASGAISERTAVDRAVGHGRVP